jgi:flagellar protein FliS
MSNPLKAYSRAAHTVAKTRQVVMLYDGAVRLIQQAAEAIEKNDVETRYNKLTRASEVINGLQNSLDFEAGGNTANILYDFYSSLDARIFQLHREPTVEACERIVNDLKQMRTVWDEIDRAQDGAPKAASSEVEPTEPTPTPTDPSGSVKFSA